MAMAFLVPSISFASKSYCAESSLCYRILTQGQGVFSINVPSIPSSTSSILPPASSIPVDNLIRKLSMEDSFAQNSTAASALKQKELNFFKKNRDIYAPYTKKTIVSLDRYISLHKRGLKVLNNLQIIAKIIKCNRDKHTTPNQCAKKAGKDVLMQIVGGKAIQYLGLASAGTLGALVWADVKAVVDTAKFYNEATGLIEDEKNAQNQKIDRLALGANMESMKFYLKLSRIRYEQNQNSLAELLILFWKNAENQSVKLKTPESDFSHAWKRIEAKNYSKMIEDTCKKEATIDERCDSLLNYYSSVTNNPLLKTNSNVALTASKFQTALYGSFEKKCTNFSKETKKNIEIAIQKKVDSLHHWYSLLDFSITKAKQAQEKYLSDQKKYLQKNRNLNQHYKQQLVEKYGKTSPEYANGIFLLNKFRRQMKAYEPKKIKGNFKYISKRVYLLAEDFELTKGKLAKVFNDVEIFAKKLDKTNKSLKSVAQSKAKNLADKFKPCYAKFITDNSSQCKDESLQKVNKTQKEIDAIAELSMKANKKCQTTKALLSELQGQINDERKRVDSIKYQLKTFNTSIKNSENTQKKLKKYYENIENSINNMGKASTELGEFSLKICRKTKTLNDYKISDYAHNKTYRWIQNNKNEFKKKLTKFHDIYLNVLSYKKTIYDILNKKDTRNTKNINNNINKIRTLSKNININMAQAETLIQNNNHMYSIAYSRKQVVKKSLGRLEKECGIQLKNKINKLYKSLDNIILMKCPNNLMAKFKNLKNTTAVIIKDISVLSKQASNNKHMQKYTLSTKEKKNLKMTLLLVDSYKLRAKGFLMDGASCIDSSQKIMKKVFVPNVMGMKLLGALNTLKKKGFNSIFTGEKRQTLSKDKENIVFNQKPQTRRRVKKETKIILDYYMSKKQTIKILMAKKQCPQNSIKVWIKSQNVADCSCEGPVFVWNKSRKACITQKQYALENINCLRFPGTVPDYVNGKAMCVCAKNLVPNKAKDACITIGAFNLENTKCQNGKKAVLYNGIVKCQCPSRTWWLKNINRCVTQYEWSQYCNSNFLGSIPANNASGCSCPKGTVWVKFMNRCASRNQIAIYCNRQFPGSVPKWDYGRNQQTCACPVGTFPRNNRCVRPIKVQPPKPIPHPTQRATCSKYSNHDYLTSSSRGVKWKCHYDSASKRLSSETQYIRGHQTMTRGYYRNGKLHTVYKYRNGVRYGVQTVYSEHGKARCIEFNANGRTVHHANSGPYGNYDCR